MRQSQLRDARMGESWKVDRPYLLAVAAGMLRRAADAEDVVQEAFARLSSASVEDIGDLRGWLVVVVRRICLDRLGSADVRLTTATADPLDVPHSSIDPADRLTLDGVISTPWAQSSLPAGRRFSSTPSCRLPRWAGPTPGPLASSSALASCWPPSSQ